jgi:hypothetical protein
MAKSDHMWYCVVAVLVALLVLSMPAEGYHLATGRSVTARNFERRQETHGRVTGPLHLKMP